MACALLRDRMLRTRLLPAFEMSEKKLDRFLDEIQRSAARKCCSVTRRRCPILPGMPKRGGGDGRPRHSGRLRHL